MRSSLALFWTLLVVAVFGCTLASNSRGRENKTSSRPHTYRPGKKRCGRWQR